jgi:Fe-S-cluster-containing dehydrogenase component
MHLPRRGFLRSGAAATALGVVTAAGAPELAWARPGESATLIDITRCDGCAGEAVPRCVAACRGVNQGKFPEPRRPIPDLWPQKGHDDWSGRRDRIDVLSPYNWTTVQQVDVDGERLFIPRRCMHCDNPPCANLCPFGALNKHGDGAVVINAELCLGGAKCNAVCPWHIPQRQSGVGPYLMLQPVPAGGGVMYKCDLCHDRISRGGRPACVEACEGRKGNESALGFGLRPVILRQARARAGQVGGQIYGERENGGTATLYVSRVPFQRIDEKLRQARTSLHMGPAAPRLEETNPWAKGFVLGPVAAVLGALGLAFRVRKTRDTQRGDGDEAGR